MWNGNYLEIGKVRITELYFQGAKAKEKQRRDKSALLSIASLHIMLSYAKSQVSHQTN